MNESQGVLTLVIATITAFITWFYSKKNYEHQIKELKQQNSKEDIKNAIEIANKFADEIIALSGYMDVLFYRNENKGEQSLIINEVHKKIFIDMRCNKKIEFTKDEALTYLPQSMTIDEFCLERLQNLDVGNFITARTVLLKTSLRDMVLFHTNYLTSDEEKNKIILIKEYEEVKLLLLNKLESISMAFNTGIADESTVYQSLHQSFISTVSLCYLDLSSRNETLNQKYYTNIIQLFQLWNTRSYKKRVEEENAKYLHECQIEEMKEHSKLNIIQNNKKYDS